jgi:uncharacterized protein YdeI (YjbR/CyaY-like superfamily)
MSGQDDQTVRTCPACGAPGPGSVGECQKLFAQVLEREFADPALYGAHRLVVDAYCLQHPEQYMKSSKSAAAHLAGMCWSWERGLSRHMPVALSRWLDGARKYAPVTPPAPRHRGELNIGCLAGITDADDYLAAASEWARSAWNAWSVHWPQARRWVNEATAAATAKSSAGQRDAGIRPIRWTKEELVALRSTPGANGRAVAGDGDPLDFASAAEWRKWLERNHAKSQGEWVYMYKKGARAGLRYQDALDEALCFGWIDGQIHAVDAEKFRQRWTPRRKGSVWSQANKDRVKRLIAEGKMCAAGLAEVRQARKTGKWQAAYTNRREDAVPPDLEKALRADPEAWRNFHGMARTYRNLCSGWVREAKRPETRLRRVAAVVRRVRANLKPGISSMYELH